MKIKLYLIIAVVFLIAVIYDSVQIFQYGIDNYSTRFIVSYILDILGLFAWCFLFYYHSKNK